MSEELWDKRKWRTESERTELETRNQKYFGRTLHFLSCGCSPLISESNRDETQYGLKNVTALWGTDKRSHVLSVMVFSRVQSSSL